MNTPISNLSQILLPHYSAEMGCTNFFAKCDIFVTGTQ